MADQSATLSPKGEPMYDDDARPLELWQEIRADDNDQWGPPPDCPRGHGTMDGFDKDNRLCCTTCGLRAADR